MLRIQQTSQKIAKFVKNVNSKALQQGTSARTTVENAFVKVENKVQGTIFEKWLLFWKTVFKDYRDVSVDVYKDVKTKPLKAVLIASTLSGLYYCGKNNPDETSFRDAFLKAANEVLLINPSLHNKETANHLRYIEKAYNNNQVRRMNCGVFSLMWVDLYSDVCHTYEAHCDYLQLDYKQFGKRILDVGFLNHWWILSRKMVDYDVNY